MFSKSLRLKNISEKNSMIEKFSQKKFRFFPRPTPNTGSEVVKRHSFVNLKFG